MYLYDYKNENFNKVIDDGIRNFCLHERVNEEYMRLLIKKFTAIFITMVIMILCIGCTDIDGNGNSKRTTNNGKNLAVSSSPDKIGLVMEGIDVPEDVLVAAKTQVQQLFAINRTDYPDYNYINWRIERLTYSYTYDDLNGMQIVIFQMNYEIFTESPENILLTGGMYITEDNWVMPSYPNSTYLIFQRDGDNLKFLRSMAENDCTPGTELFTEDLLKILT